MNAKSLAKIQAATSFLRWFCMQNRVRPYLDQPYQLALKLIDCCDGSEYCSMEDLARSKREQNTACQALSALRNGGLVVVVNTPGGWKPLEVDRVDQQYVPSPARQTSRSPYESSY